MIHLRLSVVGQDPNDVVPSRPLSFLVGYATTTPVDVGSEWCRDGIRMGSPLSSSSVPLDLSTVDRPDRVIHRLTFHTHSSSPTRRGSRSDTYTTESVVEALCFISHDEGGVTT